MKRIDVWETSDGQRFESEAEAQAHEGDASKRSALYALADRADAEDQIDFIMGYWADIQAIMAYGHLVEAKHEAESQ